MKIRFGTLPAAVALCLSLVSMPSHAQWIVFDPTNYVQNTISAVKGVLTEISTATSAVQNVKQTIELIRSTASLEGLAQLAGLEDELMLYEDIKNTDGQLKGLIDNTTHMYQDLASQYGASNFSFQEFMNRRTQNDIAGAQSQLDKYKAVTESIDSVNKRRERLLSRVQNATGQTQATQAVSAQLDILIGMNQQFMSMLSQNIANEGAAKLEKTNSSQIGDAIYQQYQTQLRDSANKF